MHRSSLPGSTPSGAKWYRQPVAWLAALIFLASLLACIVTIVLATRNADAPVETSGPRVLKVPTAR